MAGATRRRRSVIAISDRGLLRRCRIFASAVDRQSGGDSTVTTLRDRQRQFFRSISAFPNASMSAFASWEQMQDWHIRNLRPLNINRAGDGRWQMDFIMSVLVLKHELPENEIGQPYDR